MKIEDLTIATTFKNGVKILIIKLFSVKVWAAIFLAYMNVHIIYEEHRFDLFGITAFLLCLGIREAADYLQRVKQPQGGEKT